MLKALLLLFYEVIPATHHQQYKSDTFARHTQVQVLLIVKSF
jgi:hypothetical protein